MTEVSQKGDLVHAPCFFFPACSDLFLMSIFGRYFVFLHPCPFSVYATHVSHCSSQINGMVLKRVCQSLIEHRLSAWGRIAGENANVKEVQSLTRQIARSMFAGLGLQ